MEVSTADGAMEIVREIWSIAQIASFVLRGLIIIVVFLVSVLGDGRSLHSMGFWAWLLLALWGLLLPWLLILAFDSLYCWGFEHIIDFL